MGKCLNYPQTVLSEAIGCVYGIFSIVVLFYCAVTCVFRGGIFLHSDALDYANTTKKPFVRNVLTGLPSLFALFFTPTFVRDIFLPCKT